MAVSQGARHGLNMMGCVATTVEGLRIEHTGGDGISVWTGHRYAGPKHPAPPPPGVCSKNRDCTCENTLIRDVICDSNYRAAHTPFSSSRWFSPPQLGTCAHRARDVGDARAESSCDQLHVLKHRWNITRGRARQYARMPPPLFFRSSPQQRCLWHTVHVTC